MQFLATLHFEVARWLKTQTKGIKPYVNAICCSKVFLVIKTEIFLLDYKFNSSRNRYYWSFSSYIVISVLNGFEHELTNRFLNAHAPIMAYRYPAGMSKPDVWAKKLKKRFSG